MQDEQQNPGCKGQSAMDASNEGQKTPHSLSWGPEGTLRWANQSPPYGTYFSSPNNLWAQQQPGWLELRVWVYSSDSHQDNIFIQTLSQSMGLCFGIQTQTIN